MGGCARQHGKACEPPWEVASIRHSPEGGKSARASKPLHPPIPVPPVPPMTADAPGEATQTPNPSFPRRRESTDFKCISGFPLKACGNDVNGGLMLEQNPPWEDARGAIGKCARHHVKVSPFVIPPKAGIPSFQGLPKPRSLRRGSRSRARHNPLTQQHWVWRSVADSSKRFVHRVKYNLGAQRIGPDLITTAMRVLQKVFITCRRYF